LPQYAETACLLSAVAFNGENSFCCKEVLVKVSEQSTVLPRAGEEALPQTLGDNIAAREKVSLSAMVARSFVKFDIGLRARLLGRLLASVGPLALKVVGGGVFAKYVRHARSPGIPVSFEDAVRTTSTQVCDLVHYVEQSNPNLVEELSTALSLNDGAITSAGTSVRHCDQRPLETQRPSRRIVDQQTFTHDAPSTSQ
jgi:hypothetical protein